MNLRFFFLLLFERGWSFNLNFRLFRLVGISKIIKYVIFYLFYLFSSSYKICTFLSKYTSFGRNSWVKSFTNVIILAFSVQLVIMAFIISCSYLIVRFYFNLFIILKITFPLIISFFLMLYIILSPLSYIIFKIS